MPRKSTTRERILQASLQLFNEQGERNVTTNHIAGHLGMSPGNLYYHFRNKQMIVAELFTQLEQDMAAFFTLRPDGTVTLEDKAGYLERLLQILWQYRFLHQDLEHLLTSDPALAQRFRTFSQHCLADAQRLYQAFVQAGVLQMNQRQLDALAVNAWVVANSWIRLMKHSQHPDELSEDLMRQGIYQLLMLEDGYVAPAYRSDIDRLHDSLRAPLQAEASTGAPLA